MKTLREVLFERHEAVEPKLGGIREQVIAGLAGATAAKASVQPSSRADGWRQFVWSLRWHVAAMGAAWLLVFVLNIDHTPSPARTVAAQLAPSPQQWMTALRENQRQLSDWLTSADFEPAAEPPKLAPSPRSETSRFPIRAV